MTSAHTIGPFLTPQQPQQDGETISKYPHNIYELYFWTDYIKIPKWIRRVTQRTCHTCDSSLTAYSKHCHLCGILHCTACMPSLQVYNLPQRFNVKKQASKMLFTVCTGCVGQINTRRLSILSELSQAESNPLTNYVDLSIISCDPSAEPQIPLSNLNYLQLNILDSITEDESSHAPPYYGNLLHSFLGIDVNTTIKQLYQYIYHTSPLSSQTQHLQRIVLKKSGKIISLDDMSRISVKHILPVVELATDEDINAYISENGEQPVSPATISKLLREREDARRTKAREQSSIRKRTILPSSNSNSSNERHQDIGGSAVDLDSTDNKNNIPLGASESINNANLVSDEMDNTPNISTNTHEKQNTLHKEKDGKEWVIAIHTYVHKQEETLSSSTQNNKKKSSILSFVKGDRLQIVNTAGASSSDWLFALTSDGLKKGWIPRTYVMEEGLYKEMRRKRAAEKKAKAALAEAE